MNRVSVLIIYDITRVYSLTLTIPRLHVSRGLVRNEYYMAVVWYAHCGLVPGICLGSYTAPVCCTYLGLGSSGALELCLGLWTRTHHQSPKMHRWQSTNEGAVMCVCLCRFAFDTYIIFYMADTSSSKYVKLWVCNIEWLWQCLCMYIRKNFYKKIF